MAPGSASSRGLSPPNIPINSRWCKRALRPLTSIYIRLDKHWKISPLQDGENYVAVRNGNSLSTKRRQRRQRHSPTTTSHDSEFVGSISSTEDPNWLPNNFIQNRIKRNYSGRKERATSRSKVVARSPEPELQPGQFTIATPLIMGKRPPRRVITDGDSKVGNDRSPSSPHDTLPTSYPGVTAHDWNRNEIRSEPISAYQESPYLTIIQSISVVWETFIRMTGSQAQDRDSGAKSLLSIALKTASRYIMTEQERIMEDKEVDATDVADFIFTELERTYAMGDHGWKPLKVLVRSHGIRLMCEMIRRRWISPHLTRQIISQSIKLSAHDAAKSLLSALLSSSSTTSLPSCLQDNLFTSGVSVSVLTLGGYFRKSNNLSILFGELASLLRRNSLPVEWVATDATKQYLGFALQYTLYDNEYFYSSSQFIMAVALAAARSSRSVPSAQIDLRRSKRGTVLAQRADPTEYTNLLFSETLSDTLDNTITSILSVLCGSHFARSKQNETACEAYLLLMDLSATVQQRIEQGTSNRTVDNAGYVSARAGAILISDFLVNYLGFHETPNGGLTAGTSAVLVNFGHLARVYPNKKKFIVQLSTLVMNVARCVGRVENDDGFEVIKRFTECFRSPGLEDHPIVQLVLSKIAIEVALEFAEFTCLQDHHDWALHIQDQAATYDLGLPDAGKTYSLTPSLSRANKGYRWEDGIGEWVAKSPTFTKNRTMKSINKCSPVVSLRSPSVDSSASDTPDSENWNSDCSSTSKRKYYESSLTSDYESSPSSYKKPRVSVKHPPVQPQSLKSTASTFTGYYRRHPVTYMADNSDFLPDRISEREPRACRRSSSRISALSGRNATNSISPVRIKPSNIATWQHPKIKAKPIEVAIAVEIPRKPSAHVVVEVVIPHSGGSNRTVVSEDETDGQGTDNEEDEDVLNNVPPLKGRLRNKFTQKISSKSLTPMSQPPPIKYQLRPRLSFKERVIQCSDSENSSDDELSFL
ncbi:hypothetical protein FQN57_004756 [Myotisia sp. PD_48]|nr:hypothetical protein FQN57_004756 [Myotisia sp. PD_48]